VGVNNDSKDVSADAWNEAHAKGNTADVLTDHDKTLHDALGIDAATLGGSSKAEVQDHAPKSHGNEAHSVTFEDQANKGVASGYAGLDANAKVPLANVAIPVQTIDGPEWTIQRGRVRLCFRIMWRRVSRRFCWFNGSVWVRLWLRCLGGLRSGGFFDSAYFDAAYLTVGWSVVVSESVGRSVEVSEVQSSIRVIES
jgi:hypothetical protein